VQAFQQLAAEPEQPGGFGRLVGEQPDVHHRVGTDGRDERITTQHYRCAERAPQLGQDPPQRAQRVGGVGEEQFGPAGTGSAGGW
jgi:hypothetical protein